MNRQGDRKPNTSSLLATPDIDAVDAMMDRLIGSSDHAGRMAREHLSAGGKRLRARLALAAGEALGAGRDARIAWAAAVELLHNATLVHDDIQDGDRTRRGRPTLWAQHGVAQAINAGDMLLMLPYLAIAETRSPVAGELSRVMAEHALRTVRGQICELDLLPSESFEWDAYMGAIAGKTGSLLALPVHGSALLSGRTASEAEALCAGFMPLGTLFQLQDDLLDLYGDKGRDRVACDLYEGKISAPVVAHLALRPRDREWLLELLRAPRDRTDPREVERARNAFLESGAVDEVLDVIRDLSRQPMRNEALRSAPGLRDLAHSLSRQATAPIRHLFPETLGVVA